MKRKHVNILGLLLALALLVGTVGGTVAFLLDQTNPLVNTFTPGKVTPTIEETFNGTVKHSVRIRNTGDVPAYIRAKVIVTWKDADGNVYGSLPEAGTDYMIKYESGNWFEKDQFWYCVFPVLPGNATGFLIGSCTAVAGRAPEGYDLSVEILAEAIQSEPTDAVVRAWGFIPTSSPGVLPVG